MLFHLNKVGLSIFRPFFLILLFLRCKNGHGFVFTKNYVIWVILAWIFSNFFEFLLTVLGRVFWMALNKKDYLIKNGHWKRSSLFKFGLNPWTFQFKFKRNIYWRIMGNPGKIIFLIFAHIILLNEKSTVFHPFNINNSERAESNKFRGRKLFNLISSKTMKIQLNI